MLDHKTKSNCYDVHMKGHINLSGVPLLADIELTIKAGQWTALLGPSGSGKSTLLRLLCDLDTVADFTGTIRCGAADNLVGKVSYMAQDDLLLPWANVKQNVELGAKLRGQGGEHNTTEGIIQAVGLAEHAHKRPLALSGGQRQRVALARTLKEKKPVILLDEPFSALDARTRAEMQELAAIHLSGKTVLLVTHDPGEAARLCQSIYLLQNQLAVRTHALSPPFPKAFDDQEMLTLQGTLMKQIRRSEDET